MGCGKQGTVRLRIAATVVQSDPSLRERTTPDPALRATFPSKAEEGSRPAFEMCECRSPPGEGRRHRAFGTTPVFRRALAAG